MAEYTFVRRYDSSLHWCLLVLFAAISLLFAYASIGRPVVLGFSVLFLFGCWALCHGILRDCTSGISIDAESIHWFQTGFREETQAISLSSISRVERLHFDGDRVTLVLKDDTRVRIDDRFYGDGDVLLKELSARTSDVTFVDNGSPWNG